MTARIEIFRGKGRILPGYFYRIVASNGQVTAVSESYVRKSNAKRAAHKQAEHWSLPVVEVEPDA